MMPVYFTVAKLEQPKAHLSFYPFFFNESVSCAQCVPSVDKLTAVLTREDFQLNAVDVHSILKHYVQLFLEFQQLSKS